MSYKTKIIGIYIIQSVSHPERCYIGSAWDVLLRWANHKQYLAKNKHHSIKLQNHYNKYGEDDLIFEIVEEGEYVEKNHLLAREQLWYYRFKEKGREIPYFNITPIAGSCKGITRSKETRDKLSKIKIGTTAWNKGLKYSILKGEQIVAKKEKKSFYIDGKRFNSDESKAKMSEVKKHQSEETRKKNSEGRKQYWIKWREERGLSPIPVYKPAREEYIKNNP